MKRVRNKLKRPDGTPWPYGTVLSHVAGLIREASAKGTGLRLTGEEVRALDWSILREDGGIDVENHFRLSDHASLSGYFEEKGGLSEAGRSALSQNNRGTGE